MSDKSDESMFPEDDKFVEFLRNQHERLLSQGSNAQIPSNPSTSGRMRSAAMVLDLLEEWKSFTAPKELQSDRNGIPDEQENILATASKKLGRFQIHETIGRGGYGIVVRAYDPKLDRSVAIKIPKIDAVLSPEANERFQRESRLAAGLCHDGIVSVFETGKCGGIDFIVSELVAGEDLASLCSRGHRFAPRDAAHCVRRLADAIEYAHQAGVLHRDLKPSNVLIPEDDLSLAKITDFGLATVIDDTDLTHSGSVLGTPAFMSPEQADGRRDEIGPSTDVYGLGAILYQLVTGVPPFSGVTIAQTAKSVATDTPRSPRSISADCPKDLEAICFRCLEKSPQRRYASAKLLRDDLDRFLKGETVQARVPSLASRCWRLAQRYPAAAVAFLALLLISCVAPLISAHLLRLARVAERSERQLQQALYLSDMNLAVREWQSANVERCEELLLRHLPIKGRADLRRFEWFYLWNVWNESTQREILFEDERLESLSVSPDGKLLALGCYDGTVLLLDRKTGEERRRWKSHEARNVTIDFDSDGKWLATADGSEQVRVWDIHTGKLFV